MIAAKLFVVFVVILAYSFLTVARNVGKCYKKHSIKIDTKFDDLDENIKKELAMSTVFSALTMIVSLIGSIITGFITLIV